MNDRPNPTGDRLTLGPLCSTGRRETRAGFLRPHRRRGASRLRLFRRGGVLEAAPLSEEDIPGIADAAAPGRQAGGVLHPGADDLDREAARARTWRRPASWSRQRPRLPARSPAGEKFVIGRAVSTCSTRGAGRAAPHGAVRIICRSRYRSATVQRLAADNTARRRNCSCSAGSRSPCRALLPCAGARLTRMPASSSAGTTPTAWRPTQLDGDRLFTINGTQTLSHGYLVLFGNWRRCARRA